MTVGLLYFAMVDVGDVYDEDLHSREDIEVYNLKISQSEGEFARAELEVLNPREGLLLDTRKPRIFISCEEMPGGDKKLLFSGRITGFPSDLSSEMVTLEYLAQPEDWIDEQSSFLDTLKVAPYYHALTIPIENRDDPDQILASRAALLHWHRATGDLSLSDILQGSETIEINEGYFFDSLQTTIGDPPLKSVNINIEVQWGQIGVGEVDCISAIRDEFINTGGAPDNEINTLTPLAFEDAWNGARIPTGYEVIESVLTPVADSFGLASGDLRSGLATVSGVDYPTKTGATPSEREVSVPRVWYQGRFALLAVYQQKRRENIIGTLTLEAQDFSLNLDRTDDIFIRLEDPVAEINAAVLDPAEPSFFYDVGESALTSYGSEIVEHGLLRARARLAKSVRAVETSIELPLAAVLDITCDYSLRLVDDRLPGQIVLGKVIGYVLEVDGDTGLQKASVTISSSVGNGFDSIGNATPDEVELEDIEYDNMSDPTTMTSAIFYDLDGTPTISVPIDVAQMESNDVYLIDSVTVNNPGQAQNSGWVGSTEPDIYLQANRTSITLDLKSMNPEPELAAEIDLALSTITFPKQVDLGTVIYDLLLEDGDQLLQEDGNLIIV